MNSDNTPRIRPFVFNPSNMQPPRSIRPLNLNSSTPKSVGHRALTSSAAPMSFHRPQQAQPQQDESQRPLQPLNFHFDKHAGSSNPSSMDMHGSGGIPKTPLAMAFAKARESASKNSTATPKQKQRPRVQQHAGDYIDYHISATAPVAQPSNQSKVVGAPQNPATHSAALPVSSPESHRQSVVIHDSSDCEFDTPDISLPDDVLHISQPMKVLDADSRPEADAENNVNQDIENDVFPFNDNLGPNDAIAMIKDIQESLHQLAQQGIQLINDMEDMINTYRLAVECAVSKETKLKHTLYCQWEGVRTDAQKLLDSVKVSVGNSR